MFGRVKINRDRVCPVRLVFISLLKFNLRFQRALNIRAAGSLFLPDIFSFLPACFAKILVWWTNDLYTTGLHFHSWRFHQSTADSFERARFIFQLDFSRFKEKKKKKGRIEFCSVENWRHTSHPREKIFSLAFPCVKQSFVNYSLLLALKFRC